MMENWQIVTIGVMVVDKIVAMSPSKMDDLVWTSVKKVLMMEVPSETDFSINGNSFSPNYFVDVSDFFKHRV